MTDFRWLTYAAGRRRIFALVWDTSPKPVNLTPALWVDGWKRRVEFALLPARCLLCGDSGDTQRDLCAGCEQALRRNRTFCARCALPLPVAAALCGECVSRPPDFDTTFAPFEYAHPLDILLTGLKFGRSLAAGRVLGELWTTEVRAALADGRLRQLPDALLPVPLHVERLRERGYNQALELARALSRSLDLPLATDLLRRDRPTPAQTNLDAASRRRSLRDAFSFAAASKRTLPGSIALVDDVMTTGATIRECARVLKRAGVCRVEAWALARAPRRR